jgi:hypothetical protein
MAEKIWIYVLNKELNASEMQQLTSNCQTFVGSWTAHDVKLEASFEIFNDRLLIMKVDESAYNASGCSIDKLMRFVQQQEKELSVELLNRFLVALEINDSLMIVHSSKIKELLSRFVITENTPVFDTTITTSAELSQWKKPLKNTWLSKYLEGISS